jgi:hypothetical protein
MAQRITVVPAYGRDYRSKEEVSRAWEAGNDFQIRDMSSRWDGSYINKEGAEKGGINEVNVRYNSLRKVFVIKVAAKKTAGGWEPGQVDEEGWEDGHVVREMEEEPVPGEGSQVPPARDSHSHEMDEIGRPMEPGQALREASIEDAWNAFAAKVASAKK